MEKRQKRKNIKKASLEQKLLYSIALSQELLNRCSAASTMQIAMRTLPPGSTDDELKKLQIEKAVDIADVWINYALSTVKIWTSFSANKRRLNKGATK